MRAMKHVFEWNAKRDRERENERDREIEREGTRERERERVRERADLFWSLSETLNCRSGHTRHTADMEDEDDIPRPIRVNPPPSIVRNEDPTMGNGTRGHENEALDKGEEDEAYSENAHRMIPVT